MQSVTPLASFGDVNMDNEEEKQKEGKGFAGLSSMVSDVDDVVASTQEKAQKTHFRSVSRAICEQSTQQAQKTATKPASQTSQAPGNHREDRRVESG